ncbi:vasotab [Ceratitis capitata]|uniref:(Mediterranean fruit fly) hypothetical protein n=1 Tax=Ceratitis capitata TaxID=7213 RepID=A0A811V0X6_CERCA|nr:vasotab [Ceratitis capitata]CAD7003995.1 unnamed protein product [Ceratitis capitata]
MFCELKMRKLGILVSVLLLFTYVDAQCPQICPAIYTPTCGFNGRCYKSYGNSCSLNAEACTTRQNIRQVDYQECSRPGAQLC